MRVSLQLITTPSHDNKAASQSGDNRPNQSVSKPANTSNNKNSSKSDSNDDDDDTKRGNNHCTDSFGNHGVNATFNVYQKINRNITGILECMYVCMCSVCYICETIAPWFEIGSKPMGY